MIRKYAQTWLTRRFAIEESKQLAQRDVLVFFNREGYLYLVLLIITFIAGVNYGNNLVLGLCFLFVSLLVLSFYLAFKQLYGLNINYEVEDLGQVEQPLLIKFNLMPKKGQIHLHLRTEFLAQAKKITVLNSPLVIEYADFPQKRGLYHLPRLYFYSVYPFGIIRAWSYLYPKKQIWVAPKPLEFDLMLYGYNQNQQEHQQGIEDFSHLRDFQQGDQLNRVAWQQLAKGRGLLVKQFEEHEQKQQHFDYASMPASLHEDKLSQLMYLIETASALQKGFSLSLPSAQLPYGQGDQHFYSAKRLLAEEP